MRFVIQKVDPTYLNKNNYCEGCGSVDIVFQVEVGMTFFSCSKCLSEFRDKINEYFPDTKEEKLDQIITLLTKEGGMILVDSNTQKCSCDDCEYQSNCEYTPKTTPGCFLFQKKKGE